jgi:hypothetical protein
LPPPESRLGKLDPHDPASADLIRLLELHYKRIGNSGQRLDASDLDLSGRLMEGVDLVEARFRNCVFDRAKLRDANLAGVELSRCSFVGADLTSATFAKAEAFDSDFREAILQGANCLRWDNVSTDFRQADLAGANLRRFSCYDCDLRDAILCDASFDRTILRRCLLGGARLIGASGTLLRDPINVGTRKEPRLLDGDQALGWLRAAGATDISWFAPQPR